MTDCNFVAQGSGETSKRAALLLPGEGQRLISDNLFEQSVSMNKSHSAMCRTVSDESR
jgi:hypothetical protein